MSKWYEKIGSIFPERIVSVRWVERESVAEITSDGERVTLRGVWYVKKGGERGCKYELTERIYKEDTTPCEVLEKSKKEVWARRGMEPICVRKGNVMSKTGIWGATDEDVEAVRGVMANGPVECASDGSVMWGKSAVAVWFGNRDRDGGLMISREVRGYPHDSGREELDGPILALEV